jgi:CDGSH-type Zn-finger protein
VDRYGQLVRPIDEADPEAGSYGTGAVGVADPTGHRPALGPACSAYEDPQPHALCFARQRLSARMSRPPGWRREGPLIITPMNSAPVSTDRGHHHRLIAGHAARTSECACSHSLNHPANQDFHGSHHHHQIERQSTRPNCGYSEIGLNRVLPGPRPISTQ